MFSKLLKRMRVTGPLVVVAIVTALTVAGVPAVAGPVAETAGVPKKVVKMVKRAMGLSKKANRRSRVALRATRNAEGAKGDPGPAGAQGPQGPAGPRGATGPQGPAGQDGTDGDGVTATAEPAGVNCGEGGVKLDVGGDTRYVCNGSDGTSGQPGDPWTAGGTLPPGETMTGTWSADADATATAEDPSTAVASITFPIPLDPAVVEGMSVAIHKLGEAVPNSCTGGTVAEPKANEGVLCVYTGALNNAEQPQGSVFSPAAWPPSGIGLSANGAVMLVSFTGAGYAFGTYAVTAPTP